MTGTGGSPWWASEADPRDGLLDEDPLTAHRQGRRGPADDTADDTANDTGGGVGDGDRTGRREGLRWEDAAEALANLARQASGHARDEGERPRDIPPHEHGAAETDVCEVCPICVGLRALERSRPELVSHLSEALRHLTLAAKAVIDAQVEATGASDDGLERIDLDDE